VNESRAQVLAAELGERSLFVGADVRDPGAVDRMFEAVRASLGGIDIVVNNAAVLRDRTIRNMTDEDWQAVIDTNLTGVFHMNRAAARHLRDDGRIVSMASIAATVGFFGQANYAAAKAGVAAMTRVLSRELARRRITVNAVAPGVVLTEMGKSIPEGVRESMLAQIPLGRFGEPDEIANVILFLCSPLASYITGQTLHVNGGWTS
jgi:3-oxoacyl-[acyl-carrier protein] reductase